MKAISNIAELSNSQVLYHTAFGFSSVTMVTEDSVSLSWEQTAVGLPENVAADTICRVYQSCPRGGFFDLAVNDPSALRQLTHLDPTTALDLLLRDIDSPLTKDDAVRWFTSRGLISAAAFGPWWQRICVLANIDPRFALASDTIRRHNPNVQYADSLNDDRLSAADRITLAKNLRHQIGDERFISHLIISIPAASTPVKRIAIEALNEFDPNIVIPTILDSGDHHLDTLIYALRNANWDATLLTDNIVKALVTRLLAPVTNNDAIRGESRLGAALVTWGIPGFADHLLPATTTTHGRRLIRATVDILSNRHGHELLNELGRLHGLPAASRGFIDRAKQILHDATNSLTPPPSERSSGPNLRRAAGTHVREPLALADLPAERAIAIVDLGAAIATCLARIHALDKIVNPTSANLIIQPDGQCTIDHDGLADIPLKSPHFANEVPSMARDIYACASLLLGTLIGKELDPNIPADAYLPYVRQLSPFTPPASLAPLTSALSRDPQNRPDAALWVQQWMAVVDAENARSASTFNGAQVLQVGCDTHIGRQKMLLNQTNQDALFVSKPGPNRVLMVADGISTATAGSGDLASAISCQIMSAMWDHQSDGHERIGADRADTFIDDVLAVANRSVCETSVKLAAGSLDGKIPMGTTVTIAIAQGNLISLATLGDSRAYLVGPYGASLLTSDQTQARDRLIEWSADQTDRWRQTGAALVGYIGHFDNNQEPTPIPAKHRSFTMLSDETLIICSDGVTNFIAPHFSEVADLLTRTVREYRDENDVAQALINAANRGGGGDNATIIVARVRA